MKAIRIAGISAMVVLSAGMTVSQDVAHDLNKGVSKTGHVVKHVGTKVGRETKSGVKDAGHGTKVVAKDSVKDAKTVSKKTGEGIKDAVSK